MSEKLDELRRTVTESRARLRESKRVLGRVDRILNEGGQSGGERRPVDPQGQADTASRGRPAPVAKLARRRW